jgi:hypothetical protein
MEEKDIIFNSAKSLFEVGKSISAVDKRIGEMCIFLSDRTLSIGEEKGYHLAPETECQCQCKKEEGSDFPSGAMDNDVEVLGSQFPMCNGHSNSPQPKSEDSIDVQNEVRGLVEKIRSESKK